MQWYLVFGSILTIAIAVFALQNPEQVTFKFLLWQLPSFPMVLVIFFSTALGALTSLLFSLAKQLKYTLEIRDLHGKVKTLQKRVAELEAPISGQQTTGAEALQYQMPKLEAPISGQQTQNDNKN